MKPYTGIIGRSSRHIDPEVKRAVTSYYQQKQRCENPRNNRYGLVGARGIEVHYTLREYVTWWLREIARRPHWTAPTCGRIDHEDHYRFGNIELVERSENSREMNKRRPFHERNRPVELKISKRITLRFSTPGEASRVTGIPKSLIQLELDGKIDRPSQKFGFRYAGK